jgi:hypothetical protein
LSYKGIQAYWPNSESAAATRRFELRWFAPRLQPAHHIGEHPDRHEKADPCEAEFDGAKIGFVGRAVMMIKHGHCTAPALDARILILFPYTENGHSILQRTNRRRLGRTGFPPARFPRRGKSRNLPVLNSGPIQLYLQCNNLLEGGDPVSHCHDLRTSKAANWILLAKDSAA